MVKEVVLVTSGDLRLSANQACWPAQKELEERLTSVLAAMGVMMRRAFPVDEKAGHGFLSSQRMGMDVFATIPKDVPLIFATAAWQYTHHVLPGMRFHKGPMLTIANWSGQWPGLVGLLNLNGSLIKAGVKFSTLWSRGFDDAFFLNGLKQWLETGTVTHDLSHVEPLKTDRLPETARTAGREVATALRDRKAIFGIFDEGCMGMYNAIIDDELLNPCGFFKERLSQSALAARMTTVSDEEAAKVRAWLDARGLRFVTGKDEATELTDRQILLQAKMYIAAVRMAAEFGCDAIGIQYQQGLKDTTPASDLVEGLLNNPDRPPVFDENGVELFAGKALPHFNEVDEGAGVDALVTNRCWVKLGLDPSTTLHDVRWGEELEVDGKKQFVWVLQISGAAPASHFVDGYAGSVSERQPAMYFPLGGGSLKGVGKPGEIVWSRVFVESGALHVDLGRGTVVALPKEETERRWRETTYQWPIVNTVLHGVTRDSFMARHRANHISIAYANDAAGADHALAVKAAAFAELGINVHLCGVKA
ncbi:MAG: fucose isomerase [Acidobacteria bacterium]|nr:fucose isomerase [Acidobacteriota bacterium]